MPAFSGVLVFWNDYKFEKDNYFVEIFDSSGLVYIVFLLILNLLIFFLATFFLRGFFVLFQSKLAFSSTVAQLGLFL